MLARERVRFIGRVQGVGFRATCLGVADEEGVVGWVRNEGDGSVLSELQAEAGVIERFLGRVARETFGRVERAERQEIADVVDERGFEIRA